MQDIQSVKTILKAPITAVQIFEFHEIRLFLPVMRFLCLHGQGTNSQVLEVQLSTYATASYRDCLVKRINRRGSLRAGRWTPV